MPVSFPTSKISDKHKLSGLDHLRAFAITFVFLFHYRLFGHPDWVDRFGAFGWTGVDLFFVLSGFLISGQLFNVIAQGRTITMGEFFIKRFFRIIPPYLVIVGLYFIFPILREREQMAPLWRYLTFTLNFGLDLQVTGTFTHAWSLCVEEQFYLLLPLTVLCFNRLHGGKSAVCFLILLFTGGFVIRYINWQHFVEPHTASENFGFLFYKFMYYPTYNRLDGLLTGVSIAGLYTFYPGVKDMVNKYSNFLLLTGAIVLIGAYIICTPMQTFNTAIIGYPLIATGYGLIVAAVVCPNNVIYHVKLWITSHLATLSYGIYLVHKLAIHLTQSLLLKTGIDQNSNLMMLCCICSTITLSLVLRYAIEKPSIKWRNKLLKAKFAI